MDRIGEGPRINPSYLQPISEPEKKSKPHAIARRILICTQEIFGQISSFMRLAWCSVHIGVESQSAIRSAAGTWSTIICFFALTGIASETIKTVRTLHKLQAAKETSRKEYLKAALYPLLPHKPLLRDFATLICGVLFMASELSKSASAAVGAACVAFGTISSALSIVIGGTQIGIGTKEAWAAHKEVKKLQTNLQAIEQELTEKMNELKKTPKKAENQRSRLLLKAQVAVLRAKTIQTSAHLKTTKWNRTKALLKMASGALITIAGAITIATFFIPPAYPLLPFALIGISLAISTVGISVYVSLKDRIYQGKPPPINIHKLQMKLQNLRQISKKRTIALCEWIENHLSSFRQKQLFTLS